MQLPPAFLDELRGRLSLALVVGRKVIWDRKKSNQAKGDFWAPCPFHQEKTASFHVDDRKGFYYCFGCHAKGDAITFVKEIENLGFMEAVAVLAADAGLTLPARDPADAARAEKRAGLVEVMEAAQKFYRLQIKTGAAAAARAYLAKRGLGPEALERWQIGFAPDDRQALRRHLIGAGISDAQADEAGLVIVPEEGGTPYDRFRGRILFPIHDGRGRLIAYGGRAMDPGARAKYLNSPETALFDKGRSLFNQQKAREAVGKGQPLIVAEGYMDVIALSEAGFTGAVAPLGTAVTEDQLALMWRIADEPVIALDGDTAGKRAALRVIDLALPVLEAGKGLRFALLPEGQDPDDLIRDRGRAAMEEVLARAQSTLTLLWARETEGLVLDSPERRAALDKRLRTLIGTIKDVSLRRHYGEEIARLRKRAWGPAARPWTPWKKPAPAPVRQITRGSALAMEGADERLHEAAIIAILAASPALLPEFLSQLEGLECTHPPFAPLFAALIGAPAGCDREQMAQILGAEALEKLTAERHLAIIPAIRQPADPALARHALAEELAGLKARRVHAEALQEALEDIDAADEGDRWLTTRLREAAEALDTTRPRHPQDDRESLTAANGLALDKQEAGRLDALIGSLRFGKKGRPG